MKVYSGLYVSTISDVNPPTLVNDLAYVRFSVNWKEIFGDRTGMCRVRARLISQASVNFTILDNAGSLRANFSSNSSNNSNGFNIGMVFPVCNPTLTTNTVLSTYLSLDTTNSAGVSMIIPNGNQDLYLTMMDAMETAMINVLDYQLCLFFDVDDEQPFLVDDSKALQYLFSPR